MRSARLLLILLMVLGASSREALIAGELSGRVTPAERVTSVSVLNRQSKQTRRAQLDVKTGEFLFSKLPKGTYDIILETDIGRIEGVNLKGAASGGQKTLTLTPGPVDRADLTDLVVWLNEKSRPVGAAVPLDVKLTLTKRVVTEAFLCQADEKLPDVKVKLTAEELALVNGTLAATVMFFKVRDEVPMHAEVRLLLTDGQVRTVTIRRAASGLVQADREWLLHWVANVKMFENKSRVLFIDGDDARAKILVEKIRDKKTTLRVPEPTVFWRVEIWNFRKLHGGWEKTDYVVQQRHKMVLREFRKLRWVFEPALGGFEVPGVGRTRVPDYRIPDKLNPAHGRTPY